MEVYECFFFKTFCLRTSLKWKRFIGNVSINTPLTTLLSCTKYKQKYLLIHSTDGRPSISLSRQNAQKAIVHAKININLHKAKKDLVEILVY